LNIVVTNPFAWPHVRRGAERLLNDLANYLGGQGHRVTVYAMGPTDATEDREGVRYVFIKERMRSRRRQFNSLHYFAWRLQHHLERSDADAVFALNYFDAYAALRARRRSGRRLAVLFQAVGIPTRRYFRAVPLDAWFFRTALRDCDATIVLSRFAHDRIAEDFGRDTQVIPPPVVLDAFERVADEPAADGTAPSVLFVGDVDEPRKGARALCLAFVEIKRTWPTAQLTLAGRVSDATHEALLKLPGLDALRDDIRFVGVGDVQDLPALYGAASVTVLPAVWEAFGLVLVESLASGTPLVGARHAGIVDVIDSDLVGRLFDPEPFAQETANIAGLTAAIRDVIARGKTPEVRAACRERAGWFSWQRLGPLYEDAIHAAVANRAIA